MSVLLKKTAITLACATALGAMSSPSLAGVITPTDKTAVSTGSPINSVYYGWCHHRRHHYWRGCHASWNYPYYSYAYPYGSYASAGWGPGWGGWGTGWGGGGLFGLGLL